jgi:hypothetical protein
MIGFNRAYKAVTLLVPYPYNLLNTEIIKDTAKAMFVLGGLNALGCFDGLRSSIDIARKAQDIMRTQAKVTESVKSEEKKA